MMRSTCLALVSAALVAAGPAWAQKSKDTLRIAINDSFNVLSPYDRPFDEASPFYQLMYQTLVRFNEHKGQYIPELAKAWRRIDDRTLEFDLQENRTFHSGNPFTADDVVYTLNWATDPKVQIVNKATYTWLDHAEKLGPYKVRVVAKSPDALDLASIAYRNPIFDSKVHSALANTEDYGRVSGSGTGPYKLTNLDRNTGVTIERFEEFKGDRTYNRAPIKRIQGIVLPDLQTQTAQLLTGGVDVIRLVNADTQKDLAQKPGITISVLPSGTYLFIQLDAISRSGYKPLTDERVRKAFIMAINREEVTRTFVAGGDKAELMDTICQPTAIACSVSRKPYAYNPEEAKRLLAEAGYPNGLEMPFYVHSVYKDEAEAISGQLLKVGIKAPVTPLTISVYFKKRADGELPVFMGARPTANFPHAVYLLRTFFIGNLDYWNDDVIRGWMKQADVEFDPKKQADIVRPALDRMNEMADGLPMSTIPFVFAHTKDVKVEPDQASTGLFWMNDFSWN